MGGSAPYLSLPFVPGSKKSPLSFPTKYLSASRPLHSSLPWLSETTELHHQIPFFITTTTTKKPFFWNNGNKPQKYAKKVHHFVFIPSNFIRRGSYYSPCSNIFLVL